MDLAELLRNQNCLEKFHLALDLPIPKIRIIELDHPDCHFDIPVDYREVDGLIFVITQIGNYTIDLAGYREDGEIAIIGAAEGSVTRYHKHRALNKFLVHIDIKNSPHLRFLYINSAAVHGAEYSFLFGEIMEICVPRMWREWEDFMQPFKGYVGSRSHSNSAPEFVHITSSRRISYPTSDHHSYGCYEKPSQKTEVEFVHIDRMYTRIETKASVVSVSIATNHQFSADVILSLEIIHPIDLLLLTMSYHPIIIQNTARISRIIAPQFQVSPSVLGEYGTMILATHKWTWTLEEINSLDPAKTITEIVQPRLNLFKFCD